MCVISYIPLGDSSYIFTMNRDAIPGEEESVFPKSMDIGRSTIFYPKDLKTSGSWIIADARGTMAAVMCGAFNEHTADKTYVQSHEIMLMNRFRYDSFFMFSSLYDFVNIEPFTMISIERNSKMIRLEEFRWDGEEIFKLQLDHTEPHIWSSCFGYSQDKVSSHRVMFNEFVAENRFNEDNIIDFHMNKCSMLSGKLNERTVCISQMISDSGKTVMKHTDLSVNQIRSITINH